MLKNKIHPYFVTFDFRTMCQELCLFAILLVEIVMYSCFSTLQIMYSIIACIGEI